MGNLWILSETFILDWKFALESGGLQTQILSLRRFPTALEVRLF
jgi:hypothetical protein